MFDVFSESFPKQLLEERPELEWNAAAVVSDIHEEDLQALKTRLAEKNIRLGKFVGAGNTSLIFELENNAGKKVESAVVRIEAKNIAGNTDHAFVLRTLGKMDGDFYTVQLLPRALMLERGIDEEGLSRTISALNAKGLLSEAWDLKRDALMYMEKPDGDLVRYTDGKPVQIVSDTNAIGVQEREGVDFVKVIAKEFGLDTEKLRKNKLPEDEYQHVAAQMAAVHDRVRDDIKAAGINLDLIPPPPAAQWNDKTARGDSATRRR